MEEVYRELVSDPAIRSTFFASLPSLSYSLKMSVPGSVVTHPGTPERSTDSQPDRRTVTFEPGRDRRRTRDRRSPPSEERELKAPKDRKGKSMSGKSGQGKGNASASGPVTHDTLLADVVRTLIAHEDEILALKFNHSFLMYASITEQESIFSHLFQAQAACAQASMEEPPRIVIWKALMLEVMKHVEEAILVKSRTLPPMLQPFRWGLYRNFSRVRKSVCCLLKLQARSHMSGQMG